MLVVPLEQRKCEAVGSRQINRWDANVDLPIVLPKLKGAPYALHPTGMLRRLFASEAINDGQWPASAGLLQYLIRRQLNNARIIGRLVWVSITSDAQRRCTSYKSAEPTKEPWLPAYSCLFLCET